jgi:hypothetical protein
MFLLNFFSTGYDRFLPDGNRPQGYHPRPFGQCFCDDGRVGRRFGGAPRLPVQKMKDAACALALQACNDKKEALTLGAEDGC